MTYSISTLCWCPPIASILSLRTSGKVEGKKRQVNFGASSKGSSSSGFRRIILSLFLLDFGVTSGGILSTHIADLRGGCFQHGASGLGLLYAAPSAGSLLGSMTLLMAGDIRHKGIAVDVAAVGFAAGWLLGVSHWFWLAAAVIISASPIPSASRSAAPWYSFWLPTRCLGGPTA